MTSDEGQALDRHRRARDLDLRPDGVDVDEQQTRPAEVVALVDRDARGWGDEPELAQVAAERGGRRARRRVLDHAADGERVAGVEDEGRFAPDELQRRQVVLEHELVERVELVVEIGEALTGRRREDEVPCARERDPRGQRGIELAGRPAQGGERALDELGRGRLHARRDARQRRGGPAFGVDVRGDRHRARLRLERHEPGAVAAGQRDARRDGRVPAEWDLGERAEVAHGERGGRVAPDEERRLGVADLGGDRLHGVGVEPCRVEDHPGRVAAVGWSEKAL